MCVTPDSQVAGEVRTMVLQNQTDAMRELISSFGETPPEDSTVPWLGFFFWFSGCGLFDPASFFFHLPLSLCSGNYDKAQLIGTLNY